MRRRLNSRAFDAYDDWLESQGLYRKQVARDGSCLFRAVAEQVFMTQTEHVQVRSLCLEYMMLYKDEFQPFLEIPLDHHVFNLQDVREWGGHTEIIAMSKLFKVDFLIYQEIGRAPFKATENNHPRTLMLSFTHGNHYDIIYKKDDATSRGFCQSVVYDILYSRVFKLKEVRLAVDTMLHDKDYANLRRDSTNSAELKEIGALVEKILGTSVSRDNSQDECDKNTSIEERPSVEDIHPDDVKGLLAHGIPPFPYKVAKSLDPDIYRNIEFDAWNTVRREARYGPFDSNGFQAGVKVLLKLDLLPNRQEVEEMRAAHMSTRQGGEGNGKAPQQEKMDVYHGHIQEMSENKGPVDVYVEEIGSRLKVPYDCLEKVPPSPPRSPWHSQQQMQPGGPGVATGAGVNGTLANYKNLTGYYKKSTLPPESEYTVARSKKKSGKQSREAGGPANRGRGGGTSPSSQGQSPRGGRTGPPPPPPQQASYTPKSYSARGMGRGGSNNYRNESPAREAFPPFAGAMNVGVSVEGVWAVRSNQASQLPPAPLDATNASPGPRPTLPQYYNNTAQPPPTNDDVATDKEENMSHMQMRAVTEALQQVMSAGGQQEVRVTGQQLEVVSLEDRGIPQENSSRVEIEDPTTPPQQLDPRDCEGMVEQHMDESSLAEREGDNTSSQMMVQVPAAVDDPASHIEGMNHTPPYMHPMANGEMMSPMFTPLGSSPSPHNAAMYAVSYSPTYPSPSLYQVYTPVPDGSSTPEYTPPPPVTSMAPRPEQWDGQLSVADAESLKVNQAPYMVYHVPVMFGGYDYTYNPWAYPVPVMPSPPMDMVPPPPMGPPHHAYPPPYNEGREGRERPPPHLRGRGRGGSPHHYNPHRHQNNHQYSSNYHGNNYQGPNFGSPMGRGSGGQRSLPPRFQRGGGPRHQYPNTPPHLNHRSSHQYEGQPLVHMGSKSSENLVPQVISSNCVGSGGLPSPPLVTYMESERIHGMLPLPPPDGTHIPPQEPVSMPGSPYPSPGYVMSGPMPWMWKMM